VVKIGEIEVDTRKFETKIFEKTRERLSSKKKLSERPPLDWQTGSVTEESGTSKGDASKGVSYWENPMYLRFVCTPRSMSML